LIEFTETVRIHAPVARVWRALTDPAEVVRWDTGVQAPLDAPADYPRPGQHVRWSYRLGPLPLTLHDRPSEVVRHETLRSRIRLGPFDFDETYTLDALGAEETALAARLRVASPVPVIGAWLARTLGAPLAQSTVHGSLAAIRAHCEGDPASAERVFGP
jgi:Polyketide cyclase / dehydrase and lipid transport